MSREGRAARARGVPLDAARRLHRRVQEAFDLGEGHDLVELAVDLVAVHAQEACAVHVKRMFSRPVSSGWKPVPTSSRLATRPWISARPEVGSVMRERILSRVDFPAPLRPTPDEVPDDLALLDLEGDVLERPEIFRFLTRIIRIRRIVLFSSCNSCNSCERVHRARRAACHGAAWARPRWRALGATAG